MRMRFRTAPLRGWTARSILGAGVALMALAAAPADAAPPKPFHIDGQRPHTALITIDGTYDSSYPLETRMSRAAAGVLGLYEGPAGIARLLRCTTNDVLEPEQARDAERIAVVHLRRAEGDDIKHVELIRLANGSVAARELSGAEEGVLLHRRHFVSLVDGWPGYHGDFDQPAPAAAGTSHEIEQPYVASDRTMTAAAMRRRLYSGMHVLVDDADRDLSQETLHVRVPAGYHPRRPAGLLIWCSPTPDGRIPDVFAPALDELNIVCVGIDNAGNERDVPDKYQLVFDAVATGRRRFHVDDRRVYITGMSGGGKVSSVLAISYPDIFAAAIPIVGFATYSELDASWGDHSLPYFAVPQAKRLNQARRMRIALVGGPPDFNYREVVERQRYLEADGFTNIRFFSYPDMGHVMPRPERFAEVLDWVDEPYREARAYEEEFATALLDFYLERRDDPTPVSEDDQAALREVIRTGPWTDAAWQALELRRTIE